MNKTHSRFASPSGQDSDQSSLNYLDDDTVYGIIQRDGRYRSMDEPLSKFVLLIPLRFNDGREVPREIILDFQEELFALGGGFTEAGTVKGAYRMEDGSKQVDHSLEIWIGIREENVPELERLVSRLGATLGQESMYFERTGSTIHFIPPQE